MDFMTLLADTLRRGLLGWVVVAALLTAFELLNPRQRQSLRQRAIGMVFWAISIPLSAVLMAAFSALIATCDLRPLVTLPMFRAVAWTGPLAAVLGVILAAIVNDFFFYWHHRIQHRWLWRFHAVHHSVRDMSAVNSYHHISETVIGLILLTIPTTFILADPGPALPFAGLVLWLHIVWIHSPTRFDFGPFRAVFCDNRFHRIHHSLEERHFDKNFGAFTTLWDRLFGTAYFPARDEWPATGLAEVDQPRSFREWLDLPVRYRAAAAQDPDRIVVPVGPLPTSCSSAGPVLAQP